MNDKTYSVGFTNAALKELARLDRASQVRVLKATKLLATHPRPPSAKRLKSSHEMWRIRVGDNRVIYTLDDEHRVVTVAKIGHRSSVYRGL
ncbi:MAG: type II toxin-antitoxin system RelE/ParE family toxin [Trueperaceae bacterium]|nr:type II toxin-antitoxin system RelE/ParE family toxin [Trueperaceae bacterium]